MLLCVGTYQERGNIEDGVKEPSDFAEHVQKRVHFPFVSELAAGHPVFHFELQLTRTKRSPGYFYLTTAEKLLFLVRLVKNIQGSVNELDDVFFKRDFDFSFGAKFGDFIEFNFTLLLEWAREVCVIDKI